jgi:hypothetical protein
MMRPGCADHDVGAIGQAFDLRAHGAAAAQGQHLDVGLGARQTADFLADLVRQLTRGAQHHGLHGGVAHVQLVQQRDGEGGGLAAARFGLGDQVVASQGQGQAAGLDGGHAQVTQALQGGLHGGAQRQAAERGGVGLGCAHGADYPQMAHVDLCKVAPTCPDWLNIWP